MPVKARVAAGEGRVEGPVVAVAVADRVVAVGTMTVVAETEAEVLAAETEADLRPPVAPTRVRTPTGGHRWAPKAMATAATFRA